MTLAALIGVTVLSWGTWLLPAQNVRVASSAVTVFYATLANLIVAFAVASASSDAELPEGLGIGQWPIAAGGACWALSGVCAFRATELLGPARAMGLWSPLNVIVSIIWGLLLFDEFAGANVSKIAGTAAAVGVLLVGLRLLIKADDSTAASESRSRLGLFWAIGAGLLWGSYFVPLRLDGTSPWTAAFPMAVGTFAAASIIVLVRRDSLRLDHPGSCLRLFACGTLWAAGNYGSLLLMERIGTGRGFAIAQLCLVVNAVLGIYLLRRPSPRSPAARRVLVGCSLATAGGIALGLTH